MVKSLSIDTTLYPKMQADSATLPPIPFYVPEDALSLHNKTIPDVNYSCDIFEKQTKNSENEYFYIANDGKKYDLKDIFDSRICNLYRGVTEKKTNNVLNNIKEKINVGYTYKKFFNKLKKSNEILGKTISISDKFYQLTGYEFNDNNAEKFLSGEIKLNCEIYAEKYTGSKIEISSPPYISEFYIDENTLNELKNSRKELKTEEFGQYEKVNNLLPNEYQHKLDILLKNGQLLQDNSEENVTVLFSLYKIATEDRAEKIDNVELLKNCIDILENPYNITQIGEDIPEEYQKEFAEKLIKSEIDRQEKLIAQSKNLTNANMFQSMSINKDKISEEVINKRKDEIFQYRHLSTCTAASIEFELATKYPAEFFRIIEGISSKNKKVNKNIKNINYTEPGLELFKTKYKTLNDGQAVVTISADENAYLLAEIQNKHKDERERSIIDILIQSAIMNLGSGQTYNSINDTREPSKFTQETSGLVETETSFVRNILIGKETFSNCYKSVDFNNKVNDLYEQKNIKNELLKALQKECRIVAGFIFTDKDNRCMSGHEITIVGYTNNLKGQGFFIIQDSDDSEAKPVTIPENELLSKIHHAYIK